MNPIRQQKHIPLSSHEKWNVKTHALGILFALCAFPILLVKSYELQPISVITGTVIYGVSFLFLFISSTTYHYIRNEKLKDTWQKIDHISIYFMISGTYVPFMLEYISVSKAIIFLSIMYFLVFLGTVFKLFFINRFEKFSVFLYIFLGWMIIFIAKSFFGNASLLVSVLVILGGVSYTGGVYFYVRDKNYDHTIWHIFVLLASILHFLAVYFIY
jgi:hemolysin III